MTAKPSPEAKPTVTTWTRTFEHRRLLGVLRAAAVCVSRDTSRPALCNVQLIPHKHGLWLTATDSYRLLTIWLPNQQEAEPRHTELPISDSILVDPRPVVTFLSAVKPPNLHRRTTSEVQVIGTHGDSAGLVVSMSSNTPVGAQAAHAKFSALAGTSDVYPNWRHLWPLSPPTGTAGVFLNPRYVADFARVQSYLGMDGGIGFRSDNELQPVVLDLGYPRDGIAATALLMPVRSGRG